MREVYDIPESPFVSSNGQGNAGANNQASTERLHMKILQIATLAVVLTATGACDMIPSYRVYNSRKTGEAHLAEAESSKQIAVQTAKAKWESADYEAKAEVRRAEGVAQANKIIGDSLKNNEAYLRYLYVNNLEHTQNQVIYVPTEAGLPILEAGRRPAPAPKAAE